MVYEEERWKEMDRDNRGDIPVLFFFRFVFDSVCCGCAGAETKKSVTKIEVVF